MLCPQFIDQSGAAPAARWRQAEPPLSSALANRVPAGSVAHCNVLELYPEQLLGLGFGGACHLSDGSNCNILKA